MIDRYDIGEFGMAVLREAARREGVEHVMDGMRGTPDEKQRYRALWRDANEAVLLLQGLVASR